MCTMSELFENVLRRIEVKFARLVDEVEQLRAERALLARDLSRVRAERDRLLAECSAGETSDPSAARRSASPDSVGPPAAGPVASDTALNDDDWERLRADRRA